MADYSNMSDQELEEKVKVGKRVQMTVSVIFGLIILAWLVLGYWQENMAVFVITLGLAIIIFIVTGNGPRQMSAELEKRKSDS